MPLLLFLAASACNTTRPAPETGGGRTEQAVGALAEQLMRAARALEPRITALLRSKAGEHGGVLVGLEHRFKTRRSLLRKLRLVLSRRPGVAAARAPINDALRYTLRVDDTPAGRYVRAVRSALAALEKAGQRVVVLRNYWRRGDNYSGINCSLRAANGFVWELQFHTTASLRTKSDTHGLYARMRLPATPLAERLRLYKKLSAAWEHVAIPAGALGKPLHPAQKTPLLPPPK